MTHSPLSFRVSAVLRPDVQARAPAPRPAHKALPGLPAGSVQGPEECIALLTDYLEAPAVPAVIGPALMNACLPSNRQIRSPKVLLAISMRVFAACSESTSEPVSFLILFFASLCL